MTNRDFYTAIANMENAPDEIRTHATDALAKMDIANQKRREAPKKETKAQAERRAADEVLGHKILEFIGSTKDVAAMIIAEAFEKSVQKICCVCEDLVAAGALTKSSIKVDGKKRVAYSVAQ